MRVNTIIRKVSVIHLMEVLSLLNQQGIDYIDVTGKIGENEEEDSLVLISSEPPLMVDKDQMKIDFDKDINQII